MAKYTLDLDSKLERQFQAYRKVRREERGGRVLQIQTALGELIAKALNGIEPAKPIVDRVAALEARVDVLENPSETPSPEQIS